MNHTAERDQEISLVFDQYVLIRRNLQKSKPKLSNKGKGLIDKALSIIGYDDLTLVFGYFSEARDDYTRFMRGDNELKKDYVRLDSLLRPTKLAEKLVRAKRWKSRGCSKKRTEERLQEVLSPKQDDPDLFLPLQIIGGDE